MTDVLLEDLLSRRGAEQEQTDTLKAERQRLATRVALGDAEATARYGELEAQITARQQTLMMLARAVEGRNLELAEERQVERTAAAQAAADQRQQLEADYRAALVERDVVCIELLEEVLAQLVSVLRDGVIAGQRLDTLRAQLGHRPEPVPQWVQTPQQIAQRVRSMLVRELAQCVPSLGLMFGAGPVIDGPVASMSNPPAARSIAMLPDSFPRRNFDIEGEHVRPVDAAMLPQPTEQR